MARFFSAVLAFLFMFFGIIATGEARTEQNCQISGQADVAHVPQYVAQEVAERSSGRIANLTTNKVECVGLLSQPAINASTKTNGYFSEVAFIHAPQQRENVLQADAVSGHMVTVLLCHFV